METLDWDRPRLAGDGGLAQAGRVTEAEQLAKVAHGQSFGGHLGSSLKDGSRDPGLKIVSSHRCSIMKELIIAIHWNALSR